MTSKLVIASMAAVLALSFTPITVQAQSAPRDSVEGHAASAYEYMIAAVQYDKDGQYHDACRSYTSARDEFAAAIYASMNQKTSLDLEELQSEVDEAMAGARDVCGKEDEVR